MTSSERELRKRKNIADVTERKIKDDIKGDVGEDSFLYDTVMKLKNC